MTRAPDKVKHNAVGTARHDDFEFPSMRPLFQTLKSFPFEFFSTIYVEQWLPLSRAYNSFNNRQLMFDSPNHVIL